MISLDELNSNKYETTDEQSRNLQILLNKMNQLRSAYGRPMIVTSGLRSDVDQKRIYKEKASQQGLNTIRVPMKSMHLTGAACDISDPNGELKNWINYNIPLLENIGLWCEDFKSTPNWCHFQIYPPKSGKRFFIP